MLITTGWGILVPILGVAFPFLTSLFINGLYGAGTFSANPIYYYSSLFLAMIICFTFGKRVNRRFEQNNPRNPDDSRGRKMLRAVGRHTVFFIPMEYAALLIPIVGYFVEQMLF